VSSTKKYEIHSGRRMVSTHYSVSPLQAPVGYVRMYSVTDTRSGGSESTPPPGAALSSGPYSFRRSPVS
jgi:hypothetical protein